MMSLTIGALERRSSLDRAVRDALAIYYYPGMWDWDRAVRLPLVMQKLERADPRVQATGRALLDRYVAWAPPVDRFAPVMVAADFDVAVPEPGKPSSGPRSARPHRRP